MAAQDSSLRRRGRRDGYDARVRPPALADDWFAIGDDPLPVGEVYEWAVLARCGAVVLFSGTVRDHAVDEHGALRSDVQHLVYEAFVERALDSFAAIAAEVRRRWPETGRVALLHRTGRLELGESSVLAVVSAPHRPEAFAAARYAIDALKASAPIWKHETWAGGTDGPGSDWGTGAHDLVDPAEVD